MRMWIRSDRSANWHVQKATHSNGYTVCGKYLYSPYGLSKFEGERPNELENACCKRCDKWVTMKVVPYPQHCTQPEKCKGKTTCQRDPNCID